MLEIRNLHKSYPDGWTLDNVSFTVAQSENLCLLGPSGCGKTTLLRLIAGLENPEGGQVLVDGRDVSNVPSHLRGFGLMFQEYALFPHKDVYGNVAFGLQIQGMSHEAVRLRVAEVLELVGLAGFEHRDVNQLSGGERQRVALARSLAPRPCLLMLDEPLGALDRTLRERLLDELPGILRRSGVTSITVTHDQEEAFSIADRVVLLRAGRVVQAGTPEEVYRRPASAWVARFLGLTNLLDARVVSPEMVETSIGTLQIESLEAEFARSKARVQLLIRPEAAWPGEDGSNRIAGLVTERAFRGGFYRLGVQTSEGPELTFQFPANVSLPDLGEPIVLSLMPSALTVLPLG